VRCRSVSEKLRSLLFDARATTESLQLDSSDNTLDYLELGDFSVLDHITVDGFGHAVNVALAGLPADNRVASVRVALSCLDVEDMDGDLHVRIFEEVVLRDLPVLRTVEVTVEGTIALFLPSPPTKVDMKKVIETALPRLHAKGLLSVVFVT